MTKKDAIMEIFESLPWIVDGRKRSKIITYERLKGAGLLQDERNDLRYFQKLMNELGYSTAVGMALYVWTYDR
jgi:hypothetical protein